MEKWQEQTVMLHCSVCLELGCAILCFVFCGVCVRAQKPESRNSRGSIDREDGALQGLVSSHNPSLVCVLSHRSC